MNTVIRKECFYVILLLMSFTLYSQGYPVADIRDEFLTRNTSAVIRNDQTTIVIQSRKKLEITTKKSVTVLNKSQDGFSALYFPYNPQSKIKNLQVIVYDQEGKRIKTLKKSDFLDISSSDGFSLYTDYRALFYRYHPLSYPYTIEYTVVMESSNTIFLPDYTPLSESNVAVENSSYEISNLSGISLRKKIYSSDLLQIQEEQTETGWKYSVKGLAALESEPLIPSWEVLVPKVLFALSKFNLAGNEGSFSDWNEFGKWLYSDLLLPTQQLPEKAKAEIHSLIQDKKEDRDKVRVLYQYMQDKTRYVNVTIGIGGWKPMNVSEVYTKGYGDCKALTNYMLSILKEAGIKAYYTIINSDDSEENFDKDFPRIGGNHVVLSIPLKNDTLWLENTSQTMAFNQLGNSTANRNALAVSEEGIQIVESKKYNSEVNTENMNFVIQLSENGDASLQGTQVYKGLQYAYNLGLVTADSKKLQNIYKEDFSQLSIANFNTCKTENDRNEGILTSELDFKVLKYSTRLGNDMFFNAIPFRERWSGLQEDPNRIFPMEISFGYTDIYTFYFTPPDGYVFEGIPESIPKISEFGYYSLEFKKEGKQLKVIRTLQMKKGKYPREKFNEYVQFRNTIIKIDNTKINLTKEL